MNSIKGKVIFSIICCLLFSSVLIAVLAISNSSNISKADVQRELGLTCQNKAGEMNAEISRMEQSVDTHAEIEPGEVTIEKAVPNLTIPTNLYGYTNYTLSQIALPKPSTGTYSWPDDTLDITEKCIAGEKFDIYFTPNDTDNYDWSKVNISAGTWNEEEGRVEGKVSIHMNTIDPNYTLPTDVKAVYGQTLADVALPSDENGAFVWQTPSTSVGNVGSNRFYANYVPTDAKRYGTVRVYITVEVTPKEVTAKIPEGLKTYRGNTLGQVELPQAEGGIYKWLTAASMVVAENTNYKAVFIPDSNTNCKWIVGEGMTYSETDKGYVFEVQVQVVYHEEGAHDYQTKYDGTYHWKECICGHITNKEEHTLGEPKSRGAIHIASCTFEGCGYQVEESHSYERKVGEDAHWKECACGNIVSYAEHSYTRSVHDETKHWQECSCGVKNDETAHAFNLDRSDSSSHWKQCSCGAKTEIETHKFETLEHDDENHWYACACGAKNNIAAHTYGKWLCDEEAENHYAQCDCGVVITAAHKFGDCVSAGASQHKEVCEDCSKEIMADHTWDAGVVTVSPTELKTGLNVYTCIACGETKEEVLPKNEPPHTNKEHLKAYDETEHWDVCDDGDRYEFAETREVHTFTDWKNDEETGLHWKECTVCGYKKQLGTHTWKTVYDADYHWQACNVCGLKKQTAEHVYVKRSDEVNHWRECSCGKRIEIEQHVYVFYSYDAKGHWDECSCGKRANEAAHSYGKWKPTEDGSRHCHECVCGYEEEAVHSEDYVWTSDGVDTHTGKCEDCGGNSVTKGHEWDAGRVTVSPTETTEGVKTYTCVTCKATMTREINKLPTGHTHKFGGWSHSSFEHWKICACGDEKDRTAHTWDAGMVTQEPTETETGIKTYWCTVCRRSKEEVLPKLVHEHQYSEEYTYDETYHWKACSCGSVMARAVHTWNKGTVLKPSTIEETGIMQYQCTVCGAVKQTVLPKLTEAHEHSFGDWVAADDGIHHTGVCIYGDKELTEEHSWDEGVVTESATEATVGEKVYTCTKCEATKTETIPKHEHVYGDWVADGEKNHKKTCACGETVTEPHDFNEGFITKPATTTEKGEITYTCKTCGGTKVSPLAKISDSHNHKNVWVKKNADIHVEMCKGCGQPTGRYEPHMWDAGEVITAPTETTEGAITYHCTVCGTEKTETLAKLPHEHVYGEWIKNDKDTHKKMCGCNDVVIEAHNWNAGEVTVVATAQAEGIKTYTCTVCGETKTETIAKLPQEETPKPIPPKEIGAELTDDQSKAQFTVVDSASIDREDKDTSPAVIYTGSVDAGVQELIIPDTITVDNVEYRVVSIADGVFKNNKKLKKVTIGNCIWTIGNSAFEGCASLKTVTFKKPSRVKTIGKKAFYKCSALTKITIPKSVVTIKDSAFDGCKKLAAVTFQSGIKLKTIGVKAFNGCAVLKKITIPKDVTSIGSSAFNKCKKLGTITIQSKKLRKVGKNAFKGIKSTATIKVPAKKLAAYKKLLKNKGQGKKIIIKKI